MRDITNALKPHDLPFVEITPLRHRVRWGYEAEEVRHAASGRGDAVHIVGDAAVRDGSGNLEGNIDCAHLFVDERGNLCR